jgi:CRISPR/Cas system Type II protein with McrA/HNH and RuvC-like nuclease domain
MPAKKYIATLTKEERTLLNGIISKENTAGKNANGRKRFCWLKRITLTA